MDQGHRCGYVSVAEDHPWHGIAYNEPAPTVPVDNSDFAIGYDGGWVSAFCWALAEDERREEYDRTPEFQVKVHGGLTYSGLAPGALSGDIEPLIEAERERYAADEIALEEFEKRVSVLLAPKGWWFGFDCAHLDDSPLIWTEDRVAGEVERMAAQISAAAAFPVVAD